MAAPITTAEMATRVADFLNQESAGLPPRWASIIEDSLKSAAAEVLGAFKARGFSDAQYAAWDRSREYVIDVAMFWALTKGGALANYSDAFLRKLDRRPEMATVAVTVGGVIIQPGSTQSVAGPVVGRLNERGYRFNMSDEF